MSTFKPQRQFNGTPGQPSEGAGGPDTIERDLDEINVMFNPEATHENGDPGGIGAGNLNESVLLPEPEPGATISERLASKTITGLNETGTSTPATTIWTQIKGIFSMLFSHLQNISNPHGVTKSQIGLGNADNTSDADKPLSTAMTAALNLLNSLKVNIADIANTLTETAAGKVLDARQGAVLDGKITSHTSNTTNPHSVTKAQVGLGAVDNTADANKPISTAQATEFAKMVKKDGTVAMDTLTVTGSASVGGDMNISAGKKYKIGGVNMGPGDIGAEPAISKKTAFNPDFETSAVNIKMNGTQALGSSANVARSDHVHPVDTSRVPTTRTVNGKALSADIILGGVDIALGELGIFDVNTVLDTNSPSKYSMVLKVSPSYTYDAYTGIFTLVNPITFSGSFSAKAGWYGIHGGAVSATSVLRLTVDTSWVGSSVPYYLSHVDIISSSAVTTDEITDLNIIDKVSTAFGKLILMLRGSKENIDNINTLIDTPVVNPFTNGDFSSGTLGWSSVGSNSVSDGILSNTISSATLGAVIGSVGGCDIGDKMFVYAKVRVTNSECQKIDMSFKTAATYLNQHLAEIESPIENQWYEYYGIITRPSGMTSTPQLYISHYYGSAVSATMEIEKIFATNLTDFFGEGQEISADSAYRLYSTLGYWSGTKIPSLEQWIYWLQSVGNTISGIGIFNQVMEADQSSSQYGGDIYPERTVLVGDSYTFDNVNGGYALVDPMPMPGGLFPGSLYGKYLYINSYPANQMIYQVTMDSTIRQSGSPGSAVYTFDHVYKLSSVCRSSDNDEIIEGDPIGVFCAKILKKIDAVIAAVSALNTDKIETSAITNTLTETTTGKVLDARQGKVLADLISTNVGDLETLTTTDKSSLVNATNEVKNLIDTNTQFTDVDNVVYSWRFIKSAEGHMQLEYTEVI